MRKTQRDETPLGEHLTKNLQNLFDIPHEPSVMSNFLWKNFSYSLELAVHA